ncbi:MAG: hypothetical protein JRJ84_13275 [Deltaproteobacteria bacterium]|nr:hypothetical protein [Deltaproteobacteria bacterium]
MAEDTPMEKLRFIVGLGPSWVTFASLCRVLDEWPDGPELEAAVAEIDEALASWPVAFRAAPSAWKDAFLTGGDDPRFRLVRRVDVSHAEFGDILAAQLAGAPWMSSIKWLGLPKNDIGDAGVVALVASPYLTGLEALDLSDNDIGDVGAVAIARSTTFGHLKWLHLQGNDIGEEGVRALQGLAAVAQGGVLELQGNPGLAR